MTSLNGLRDGLIFLAAGDACEAVTFLCVLEVTGLINQVPIG